MVKKISELNECVEHGVTEPLEGKIGDKIVIVKTINNRWSNKILVNEYVSLRLGKLIELPIPNGGICLIDKDTIIEEEVLYEYDASKIQGLGFYSERIDGVTKFICDNRIIDRIENNNCILRVILFDHVIYNTDRHDGNILIDLGSSKANMHIIDHSHVFNLKHEWNEHNLRDLIAKKDYENHDIIIGNYDVVYRFFSLLNQLNKQTLLNEVLFIKQKITKKELENIVKDVPKEWINDEERLALVEYLIYRLDSLEHMCDIIYNYIIDRSGGE